MGVFRAEQEHHLRASVYSRSDQERHEHNGIVKWLDEVMGGALDNYKAQAEEFFDPDSKRQPDELEGGGTAWMATDSGTSYE